MEELVRSLRNLELGAPRGEQIVSLVDADPRVEKQLAQELAVPARLDSLGEEDAAAALMDAALLSGATEAMLANYNRALQSEVEALRREKEQCSAPRPVKRVPLKALLAQQNAMIRRREQERAAATDEEGRVYMPRQIVDSDYTYCSTCPVEALTPLDMDEFEAPKRFDTRYVVVRVASRLSLYASCSFVGQLPSGNAIPVSIAYFTPNLLLQGDELDAMLPEGTLLLIREPYISTHYLGVGGPIAGGKGTTGIRVDTPSDVHVLDGSEPWLKDAWPDAPPPPHLALWRQEGPLARAVRNQLPDALSVPDASRTDARTTIARFLAQDRPGAAWREMQAASLLGVWATSGDEQIEDELLRADVLVALRAYDEAKKVLDQRTSPPHWAERAASVAEAIAIGARGPSDAELQRMFETTLEDATPRFSYAEFIGPVAVEDIPNAGRGLVLTRDVDEGELLLLCRAIGSSYSMDVACRGIPLLRCNPDTGVTSTTTQVLAAARCMHAILDRPELALPFLGLTAGPDLAYSPYVAEAYPLRTAAEMDAKQAIASYTPPYVSSAYTNGVLRFNAFGPAATPAAASGNDPMSRSTMPHPLPAILNHACLPNVSSVFFGDMVTTRALHPLPKGTQIMHQYVQGELPYETRQSLLYKHGFQCACGLCRLDEQDGKAALRKRQELNATVLPPLVERSRALEKNAALADADAHAEIAQSLLDLAASLQETYGAERGALRPDLVDVYHRAASHVRTYDTHAAITHASAGLAASGSVLAPEHPRRIAQLPDVHFDGAIQCMLLLGLLHLDLGEEDECCTWVATAVYTHTCMIGGGLALFLQRYGECVAGEPRGPYARALQTYLARN